MDNLTITTALFDIGRGQMTTSFSRSFNHYKECFSRLLKTANHIPMIIYCESSLNEFIWQYRKLENTKIVNKTLDDIKAFPFFNEVQKIRTNSNWYNQAGWLADSTQAKLELYNPLTMMKQFLLNDSSIHNNFDTKYHLWLDAGLSNTVSIEKYFNNEFVQRITKHMNKMLYLCFPYDGTVEVHGFAKQKLNEYAEADTKWVARGGVFGGTREAIGAVNEVYYQVLHDTLKSGLMGTEESIFTIIGYKHKNLCNIRMIESNGLVYKFFEDLQQEKLIISDSPLAIYSLTYNIPAQWKMWVDSFKKAFPKEFETLKKYVINNSDDDSVQDEYNKLFKDNDFEVIHENKNIGINDGRHLCAVHFDKSDHTYYIFFEDDMHLVDESYKDKPCKNGLIRWVPQLFDKAIDILENEKLGTLKLSFTEFFGDSHKNWAWYNVPSNEREQLFSTRNDDVDRAKTKIDYTGSYKGLSFAVGFYHYCNWAILFNKDANKKLFIDTEWLHKYEQTWMSNFYRDLQLTGKVKSGVLLATPINHDRRYHYVKRKENRHY